MEKEGTLHKRILGEIYLGNEAEFACCSCRILRQRSFRNSSPHKVSHVGNELSGAEKKVPTDECTSSHPSQHETKEKSDMAGQVKETGEKKIMGMFTVEPSLVPRTPEEDLALAHALLERAMGQELVLSSAKDYERIGKVYPEVSGLAFHAMICFMVLETKKKREMEKKNDDSNPA